MKKTLKTVAAFVFCVIISCVFASVSFADVIFEPMDDFYEAHRDECNVISANYIVLEDTSAYKSPSNHKETEKFAQGDAVLIDALYTDSSNVTWGYAEKYDSEGRWIPMGTLGRVYNASDFVKEYGSAITQNSEKIELPASETVRMWNFPGDFDTGWDVYVMEDEPIEDSIIELFTAPNGEIWGHVSYYYANRGWICISDPQKTQAAWTLNKELYREYPDSLIENSTAPTQQNILLIALVLVGAVAAVSIVLLVVFGKKKKAN